MALSGRFGYRIARRRAAAAAAALLGLSTLAAAQVSSQSTAAIESTVGANWRGAYDLLVAGNGALAVLASDTAGLIEQNFAALTSGRSVSDAQLGQIRAIPEVDVAAPLSFVGQLGSSAYGLLVGAYEAPGATSSFFSQTRAFDVQVHVTTSDGVQQQTVSDAVATVVTGKQQSGPAIGLMARNGKAAHAEWATSGDGAWDASFDVPAVPALTAGLVAVDPEAELRLLGVAGGFLDPLARFDSSQSAGGGSSGLADLVDPIKHNSEHWALVNGYSDGPVVPVVVSTSAYAPLTATVTFTPVEIDGADVGGLVDQAGTVTDQGAALLAAAPRGTPSTSVLDVTKDLTPFALPSLSVALPGADAGPGGTAGQSIPTLVPALVGRSDRTTASPAQSQASPEHAQASLVDTPQGRVQLGTGASEQTYRSSQTASEALNGQPLYAPVGTYTPGDVSGTNQSAGYVPLGAYTADDVRVAQPGAREGAALAPSFSGRGAVLPSPGAITTLNAARALTGRGGSDVVRVRVAGISGYSPQARDKIAQVAAQIADLGLDVRVVAGSSLAPVGVYLPQYFPDGSDLGWTTQEWTSLGAAVRVEKAQLGATLALLAVTLAGVSILGAVVQTASVGRRRREAAFLASLGWTRLRIRSWFLVEDGPALLLVLAAGGVAVVISSTALARWADATAVAAYVVTAVACAFVAGQPTTRRRVADTGPARAVRTARGVGIRIARAHPAAGVLTGTAVIVLTAAAVSFAGVLGSAHASAGTTRLAALVSANLLLPQAALAASGLMAGVALFVAGIRDGLTGSGAHHAMLATAGWDRRALGGAVRAQVLTAIIPGAIAALVIGGIAIISLDQASTAPLLGAALAVPVATTLVAMAWATRYTRRLATTAGGHR